MGEHDSGSKLRRLAKQETARARRFASNPRLRLVVLADLPPLETDRTGGQWLAELRQAMADTLRKQGHHIKPDNINPFEAEPCAAAVLIGTVDEIAELRGRVNNVSELARGVTGDVDTATAAIEKILAGELPDLNGRCDGLASRISELEDAIPVADPLQGEHGQVETLRAKVAELEATLERLEQRLDG